MLQENWIGFNLVLRAAKSYVKIADINFVSVRIITVWHTTRYSAFTDVEQLNVIMHK